VLCKTDVKKSVNNRNGLKRPKTLGFSVVVLYCYNVSIKNKYKGIFEIFHTALAQRAELSQKGIVL